MPIHNPSAGGSASLPYLHALYVVTDDGTTLTQTQVYNDTGLTFTLAFNGGANAYELTASSAPTSNKTPVFFSEIYGAEGFNMFLQQNVGGWVGAVISFGLLDATGTQTRSTNDGGLKSTWMEVRVYP